MFLSYQTLNQVAEESKVSTDDHQKNRIQISVLQSNFKPGDHECHVENLYFTAKFEFLDEYGVYRLHGSSECKTEPVVMTLLHTGILGIPIRGGLHT